METSIEGELPCKQDTHVLLLYKEAVQWLQLVARECQKTENVDLQKLLAAAGRCAEILASLLEVETSPIRIAAVEQLSCTLQYHKDVFKATQSRLQGAQPQLSGSLEQEEHRLTHSDSLEQASRLTHWGTESVSATADKVNTCDEQLQRRTCAVEGTILPCGGTLTFADVAGLTQAKQALREAIVLPIKYPHLFTGSRSPWQRVLLYGPPGTGKTRLAKAVSGEIEATFYCVSSSDLISSWVGESEKIIKDLFSHARKTHNKAVIFIDEIDSVCRQRHSQEEEHTRRVKTELLRQMEGADVNIGSKTDHRCGEVFLLCATNCPWELDPAFLRRFQRRIYIPLPDRGSCREILQQSLESVSFSEEEWDSILLKTEGCSGSDLSIGVTDALLQPIRELEQTTHWRVVKKESGEGGVEDMVYIPCREGDKEAIQTTLEDLPAKQVYPRMLVAGDIVEALSRCGQTVRKQDLQRYMQFTDMFGQIG